VGAANPALIKPLDGPRTRRNTRRSWTDGELGRGPRHAPDDARALARLALTRVDSRCARALAAEGPMGDNTRAHLIETRARIKRALEASRSADPTPVPRPGGPLGMSTEGR
jgi:hypothetical protein